MSVVPASVDDNESFTTAGHYQTEQESLAALDKRLTSHDLWEVCREVPGRYLFRRPQQDQNKEPRIDRIAVPTERLIDAGWEYGPIGIEAKRSGEKLGPAISQAIDYARAVFAVPPYGFVYLDWLFIWPGVRMFGTAQSIVEQQGIGSALPLYEYVPTFERVSGIEFGKDNRLHTVTRLVETPHRRTDEGGYCLSVGRRGLLDVTGDGEVVVHHASVTGRAGKKIGSR